MRDRALVLSTAGNTESIAPRLQLDNTAILFSGAKLAGLPCVFEVPATRSPEPGSQRAAPDSMQTIAVRARPPRPKYLGLAWVTSLHVSCDLKCGV